MDQLGRAFTKFKPTVVSSQHDDDYPQLQERPKWHPYWLRPVVLGLFALFFTCVAVGLAVVLDYSKRHDGLGESHEGYVYLWRFGPTAGK